MKSFWITLGAILSLQYTTVQAAGLLELKKIGNVKFINEICSEQKRECIADVVSLSSQKTSPKTSPKTLVQGVQTSIYTMRSMLLDLPVRVAIFM